MPSFVTPAIPASQTVNVVPSVISAGGNALDLIGMILTQDWRVPFGQPLAFVDDTDLADYFGATAQETALGTIYFQGPNNATATPGQLLAVRYPETAVNAYLRGGNISGLALTALQAIDSPLTITIDGGEPITETINLSAATSFSNAAEIIAAALGIEGVEVGTITASLAAEIMTVTALGEGVVLAVGQMVSGTGITAPTYIASFGTGTGGTGTYNLSASASTEASETVTVHYPGVLYDSVLGAFVVNSGTTGATSSVSFGSGAAATSLLLTQATGAVQSPGAAATNPTTFMDSIIAITQNWVSFMTTWEPVDADKEAFASWTNSALGGNRFRYCMWETNALDTESGGPSAPAAFINAGDLSGIVMIYENPTVDTSGQIAAFAMSWAASLDFTRQNGMQTAKFKSQTGLQPQVFSGGIANYLTGYGLNYYGDNTTANQSFTYYAPGAISGPFEWDDDYVCQVWLNNQLQLAIMTAFTTISSFPYNAVGYALIEASVVGSPGGTDGAGPINQAVYFGMIQAGTNLSSEQVADVNNAAGLPIDQILYQRGWYFQVQPASAQVRAARSSPPCTFWYTTGGSIQQITLSSQEVQ